jgi:hypothetical protein
MIPFWDWLLSSRGMIVKRRLKIKPVKKNRMQTPEEYKSFRKRSFIGNQDGQQTCCFKFKEIGLAATTSKSSVVDTCFGDNCP